MRITPQSANLKAFYQQYTLAIWLGAANIIALALVKADFFTILFYTYLLIFTGRIFFDFISRKDYLNIWFLGVLASVVIYALFASTLSVFPYKGLVVASLAGGALALIAASATYMPEAPIRLFVFGPFPFKYLAIGLIILDVFTADADVQAAGTGVAHFAHLLGAATGFAYIYFRQKGIKTDKLFSWFYTSSKPGMKAKKGGKYHHTPPPRDDHEYRKKKKEEQEKLDEILDKISRSGYESLTKKEKELLFRQSKD
ncbi:MAG: rhomboid family intramembrane serine protease [Bacteroidales bacterium]